MIKPTASQAQNNTLLLQGGRVIDPANGIDGVHDLLIENGRVKSILPAGEKSVRNKLTVLDLSGKWVFPGFIDMHVHLREPGEEYKETIASGAKAAAAGGFTAVACMPNTKPPNDNLSVTALILKRAAGCAARVYPVGTITKELKGVSLAEIGEMKQAGIVAISDDGMPVANSQLLRRALEYCATYNLPVICHSEELSLSQNGHMNEGPLSTRLGLRGIPRVAEEIMVYRDLALAAYLKRPVHIAHISTRESVDLIRRAKKNGAPVTAETAPHYFSLTDETVNAYNTHAKMNPPLRTWDDVLAIREGLADGTIDAIATDHAPHSVLEKEVEFDMAANGIIGLETAVPLALALVREGVIDVKRLAFVFSVNPARILKVEGGSLAPSSRADITVIDPEVRFTYKKEHIVSKSKNSPFINQDFQGKAVLTLLEGRITFSEM